MIGPVNKKRPGCKNAGLFAYAMFGVNLIAGACAIWAADDIIIGDFEGKDYGAWSVEGESFGKKPLRSAEKTRVEGIVGLGCAHSVKPGQGGLVSSEFAIERQYINFKISGPRTPAAQIGAELYIDGEVVRNASATEYFGNTLEWRTWDVGEFKGRKARIHVNDLKVYEMKSIWE